MGDLALEGQLLDRARYVKALAVAAKKPDVQKLADRLITAHSATVDWLSTVLAEDALGGPAALRRTPLQAATGVAVRMVNLPMAWSVRGADRALESLRGARPAVNDLINRGTRAGEVAAKAVAASRDAALRPRRTGHPPRGCRWNRGHPALDAQRDRCARSLGTADRRL